MKNLNPPGVRVSRLLLPLLLGPLFIGGCLDDLDVDVQINEEPQFETTLTVTRPGGHPASFFGVGEPIEFTLTVRNLTDREITLTTPSNAFVFQVFDAGSDRVIWDSRWGQLIPAWVTYLTFLPGETKSSTTLWDGNDVYGVPLPDPGSYESQGFVGSTESYPHLRSKWVFFVVE